MEYTSIQVPEPLARHFVKIAERCSERLGNAGCNDFAMEDTPDNREIDALIGASNYKLSLNGYLNSEFYEEPNARQGVIYTQDWMLFDLYVKEVKRQLKEV